MQLMLLRLRHLAIPYLLHGKLLHGGDAFLLAVWRCGSYNLASNFTSLVVRPSFLALAN